MPMSHELQATIYIVAAIVLGLGYLFWLLYGPIHRYLLRHHTVRFYYRKVNQVVLNHDFYLVNQFENQIAGSETFHIDHIIVGDKYIYCIKDLYFDGTLMANPENESWIYYHRRKWEYIGNPLSKNALRAEHFALMANLPLDFIVPIVLINDDCFYTPFDQSKRASYMVSLHNLNRFVEEMEGRDVPPLNAAATSLLVADIAHINQHGKK